MQKRIVAFFMEDRLFTGTLILALIAVSVGEFQVNFIDWKVIFSLFGLMLVIQGVESSGLLNAIGQRLIKKSRHLRQFVRAMIFLSFFSSMFLTNDIAILTLLPMYLLLTRSWTARNFVLLGAVFLIIAANLGSSLFPFGNPQNLFLFAYYRLSVSDFFATTAPFIISALIILWGACLLFPKTTIEVNEKRVQLNKSRALVFSSLLMMMICGVFNLLPYELATLLVVIVVGLLQKSLFQQVDYRLLLTFISFFLIVGNIQTQTWLIAGVRPFFQESQTAFLGSFFLSQILSNVPAAIFIAPFTSLAKAVLLGVNVGGLGTFIASLANVIGYKIVKQALPQEAKAFRGYFYLLNSCGALLFLIIGYFLLS